MEVLIYHFTLIDKSYNPDLRKANDNVLKDLTFKQKESLSTYNILIINRQSKLFLNLIYLKRINKKQKRCLSS